MRDVTIAASLAGKLADHLARLPDRSDDALVFPSERGTPLDPDNLRSRMLSRCSPKSASRGRAGICCGTRSPRCNWRAGQRRQLQLALGHHIAASRSRLRAPAGRRRGAGVGRVGRDGAGGEHDRSRPGDRARAARGRAARATHVEQRRAWRSWSAPEGRGRARRARGRPARAQAPRASERLEDARARAHAGTAVRRSHPGAAGAVRTPTEGRGQGGAARGAPAPSTTAPGAATGPAMERHPHSAPRCRRRGWVGCSGPGGPTSLSPG